MSIISPSELPKCLKYYKLTNSDECHHGFQYKTGLNIDTIPFNPTGQCSPGGLYFASEVQLINHMAWGLGTAKYIRKVTFPDDARIYVEDGKYKADKIILDERNIFTHDPNNYMNYNSDEVCKIAVAHNGLLLKYVPNQTDEICKIAVAQHGCALQFVKKQTYELCKLAVMQTSWALPYVTIKSPKVDLYWAFSCNLRILQKELKLGACEGIGGYNVFEVTHTNFFSRYDLYDHKVIKVYKKLKRRSYYHINHYLDIIKPPHECEIVISESNKDILVKNHHVSDDIFTKIQVDIL